MNNRWDHLVALARAIEHARSTGAPIDPEKAKKLARGILAVDAEPRGVRSWTDPERARTAGGRG